jgi:DNA helicase-2/ATP-dependent DNA helicase PcrA
VSLAQQRSAVDPTTGIVPTSANMLSANQILIGPHLSLREENPAYQTVHHENLPSPAKSATSAFYLSTLNEQQRAAVECTDAPVIIVAGPGTGKTRTLTVRIAHLLQDKGVAPEHVLAITFTNKAAGEMAERLAGLVGAATAKRITIKTFHAFGAQLLRTHAETQGITPSAIISEADQRALLKEIVPDATEKNLSGYLDQIATAKDLLLAPDDPALIAQFPERPELPGIYSRYAARLRANRLFDFDDLIYQTVHLLATQPDLLQRYQDRYRWLSVDEYQDINYAQYRLLRLLTPPATNLCAIGDPDQAIYGFRGAKREYFLCFQADFPDAQILHLDQNYRSTQTILDAAVQVIEESSDRAAALQIWSDFVDQTKLQIYQAPTDKAEAEYVVHQTEQLVGGTSYFSLDTGRTSGTEEQLYSFGDFAVLYRTSAQSRLLIEAFDRSGIPYQTVGQTPLIEYKEIRQLLAYLWLTLNPTATFYQEQVYGDVRRKDLPYLGVYLPKLQAQAGECPVADLIDSVAGFFQRELAREFSEAQSERFARLRRRALPFGVDLRGFLEATLLQHETDHYDPRADRVTLMTLHAAKGLEFPVVFMVGCEETLLPYTLAGRESDVEEERRLFYVGMTRAQQRLILLHARRRTIFGQRVQNEPSRFLADIEATLKEIKAMAGGKAKKQIMEELQLSLF